MRRRLASAISMAVTGASMLILAMILLGLVLTAVRYPHLPIGRRAHEALIAAPALWLSRMSALRMAILLGLILAALLLWAELGPMLAVLDYAPVLWLADTSVYLDAVVMASLAVVAVRFNALLASAPLRVGRAIGSRPSGRPRRRPRPTMMRQARRHVSQPERRAGF